MNKHDFIWEASANYDFYRRNRREGDNGFLLEVKLVASSKYRASILNLKTNKVKSKIFSSVEKATQWCDK